MGSKPGHVITVTFDDDVKEAIGIIRANHIGVSGIVRDAILEYVEKNRKFLTLR